MLAFRRPCRATALVVVVVWNVIIASWVVDAVKTLGSRGGGGEDVEVLLSTSLRRILKKKDKKTKFAKTDDPEDFCLGDVGSLIEITASPDMTSRTDGNPDPAGDGSVPGTFLGASEACSTEYSNSLGDCFLSPSTPDEKVQDEYKECLEKVGFRNGPWWFNRDVYGQFNVDDFSNDDDGVSTRKWY